MLHDDIALLFDAAPDKAAACLAAARLHTPLGEMLAVFAPQGLCLLEFVGQTGVARELAALKRHLRLPLLWRHTAAADTLQSELNRYFDGSLRDFSLPLYPVGTAFQQQVWQQLAAIPYGSTISYAEQAARLGNPRAVRAVAAANGQNKISIILPCHRVIGSNGKLTGYAGGLARKQALLDLERRHRCPTLFSDSAS